MSTDSHLGVAPSGSESQNVSLSWSIAINGLWSIAVSLASAPAGNSPVAAVASNTPVWSPVSTSDTCTWSPLVATILAVTLSG